MVPRSQRLSPKTRFVNAKVITRSFLRVKVMHLADGGLKVGFVISKKIDSRATRRNRLRRILSSVFESTPQTTISGFAILCIVIRVVKEDDEDILKNEFADILSGIKQ